MASAERRKRSSSGHLPPSCHECKVLFLWVRSAHSRMSILSVNVAREVCLYLSFTHFPTAFPRYETQLITFNPATLQWASHSFEHELKPHGMKSVCTAPNSVFLCGGYVIIREYEWASKVSFLWNNGNIEYRATMHRERINHGLLFDEEKGKVYAFGGATSMRTVLNTVECFDFSRGNWQFVGNLIEKISNPVVCRHRRLVYVCGQYTPSNVEKFNLETRECTCKRIPMLCQRVLLCIVHDNQLVLFTDDKMIHVQFSECAVVKSVKQTKKYAALTGTAVAIDGYIHTYCTVNNKGYRIDLNTGEQQETEGLKQSEVSSIE